MPTGYTAGVQDGTITEFKDFALQCARAMGACITMRDDPLDAEIPDEFQPFPWHEERLVEAKQELERLGQMTTRECEAARDRDYEKDLAAWKRRRAEEAEQRERYKAMLAKVEAWKPPTREHEGLKRFMVEQLESSIKHDCGEDFERWDPEPVGISAEEWKSQKRCRLLRDIEYHQKHHHEEVERCRQRSEWVRQLRESLR